MVVNGEKIFFFEYHPFEKLGWVNPMGGYFLKKVWREAFFATPRPVLGHPPLPRRGGGVGPPENSGTEYLYHYMRQPLEAVKC